MDKKRGSYGVTPAYLAWKRRGSPGGVFDLKNDRPVNEPDPDKPSDDDDCVVALMRTLGTPMTRERYLELAFLDRNYIESTAGTVKAMEDSGKQC